ncbi:MAG: protein kinase [Planctomycetes bacterium]|nr:protein kinase [Planctomycetota bacterium]
MPRLLVEKGPDRGKAVAIGAGQQVVVGRDNAANLQLSDNMCSRRHFLIAAKGSVFGLKDLGSANGTLVNGRRMASAHRLEYGDTIQIGETLISWLPDEQSDRSGGLIGQQIGGYRIEQRLGRGAMGTVYKATQMSLGRTVALKVLSPELTKDPKFCDMFLKEARAAGGLNHSNIIQVYDVGDEAGQYFFSMEYAAKGSVLDELSQQKTLPLARAIKVIRDACAALDYAERKGLVHRDIKPDNLMVTEDDTVKLGDLGLAMSTVELEAEQDGVFGTPHYIAPEQAMGKPIDHRADIYALGASFYRVLSGRTLFEGATVKEILKKQVREPHAPITNFVPDCPKGISTIIDRMLVKNPAERYQHASDIAADLASFEAMQQRQGGQVANPLAERPRSLPPEHSQEIAAAMKSRNLALGAIAAGVAVIALVIMLYLFVFKGDPVADNGAGNAPIVAGNSGPAVNGTGKPDVRPDVAEANEKLREALSIAQYEIGQEGAGRKEYEGAVKRLGDALATWIKASDEMKERVRVRRTQLESDLRRMTERADAYRAQWEGVRQEVTALAEDFKYVAGSEKLGAFLKTFEITDAADAEVKAVQESVETYARVEYPLEFRAIVQAFQGAAAKERDRALAEKDPAAKLAGMEALLGRVNGKHDVCDDEETRKRLKNFAGEIEKLVNILRGDAERADREKLDAAFRAASGALEEALKAASREVALGNFVQAGRRLDDFELTSVEYAQYRNHDRFAPIRDDIQRRRDQTALQFASVSFLAGKLPGLVAQRDITKRVPWPEAVSKEFGGPAVVFSMTAESRVKDGAWALERSDSGRNMGAWSSTQVTTPERRKAIAGALAFLLANDVGFASAMLLTPAGQKAPAAAGIFAWLCEWECYDEAFAFIDLAWKDPKLTDAARPLVREYYAWGLLGKSLAAAEAGRSAEATNWLRMLEGQFADTRANKGRK